MRWGPGPVFVYESLVATRRWQLYALRSAFVFGLLLVLVFTFANMVGSDTASVWRQLATLGSTFYQGIAGLQLSLILLAAPAATAGAICLDRARGTLMHMMMTDLSDAEIVIGKLAARLLPVVALLATALPVLSISSLLGGIIPEALLALFLVSIALALLGCALALAVSTRVHKTHEVLMAVYFGMLCWVNAAPFASMIARAYGWPRPPDWFYKLNPYLLVYAPYVWPGYVGFTDLALFLAAAALVSLCATVYSVLTLRRELSDPRHGLERFDRLFRWVQRTVVERLPSPGLDGNPVLWREWHRNRPSPIAQRIWILFLAGAIAGTAAGVYDLVSNGFARNQPKSILFVNGVVVTFGLLFLSVTAANAMAEERVRGSLDVLMSTPISNASIVLGKWWGAYRNVPILALFPAVGCLLLAIGEPGNGGPPIAGMPAQPPAAAWERAMAFLMPVAWVLSHGALITSVGVALSTWLSRPSRAVTSSVVFYVLATIGTIFATELVARPLVNRILTWIGNPVYPYSQVGSFVESIGISLSGFGSQFVATQLPFRMVGLGPRPLVWAGQFLTMSLILSSAGLLLWFTIKTFNHAMGRMDEGLDLSALRPGLLHPVDAIDGEGVTPHSRYRSSSSPLR